jgi:hypothetical protein
VTAVAFAWIVLMPAVASLRLPWRELATWQPIGEDGISVQLRRYGRARSDLGGVPRLGYLSDHAGPRTFGDAWFHPFQVAGHAVCPTLLVDSDAETLVLGDFLGSEPAATIARRGLRVVRDYGDGVFLLRRLP